MPHNEQVVFILQLVILALVLYLLFTNSGCQQAPVVPAEELTPSPEELVPFPEELTPTDISPEELTDLGMLY